MSTFAIPNEGHPKISVARLIFLRPERMGKIIENTGRKVQASTENVSGDTDIFNRFNRSRALINLREEFRDELRSIRYTKKSLILAQDER